MKKKWQKPKLIVLYRARPEESVLAACKGTSNQPKGPDVGARCFKLGIWCFENSPT
ncbi:MAG: hypothetical protein AB1427_02170 [Thermodesulfobacteriota bacterium]